MVGLAGGSPLPAGSSTLHKEVEMPTETADLTLFHREVLLPQVKRVVEETEARVRHQLASIERRMKRIEERAQFAGTYIGRVDERVDILDLKLEALDSLWTVTKAIAKAVGAKVEWKPDADASTEEVG
jgi:hypothetical protein